MRIERVAIEARPQLESLMQSYLLEMSAFDGESPDEQGMFNLGPYFELYWSEPTRFPYFFKDGTELTGFALVRQTEDKYFTVAEFFISQDKRKNGAGTLLAKELFDRHKGRWQIAQLEANIPAQKFWRKVVSQYTNGNFKEEFSEKAPRGPMQVFTNS